MEEKQTEKKEQKKKPEKKILVGGARRSAIARAVARPGTGKIIVNSAPLEVFPELPRLMMSEPLILAGEKSKDVDIAVNVSGGGVVGQAEAVRQAIALSLLGFHKDLKQPFLQYDRTLLVSDFRRNEPHKPSRSKAGPRTHKQRSKR